MSAKKKLVVYIGGYGLLLVLGMLFQTTLAYNIAIMGIRPNIMMPIIVMAALYDGRKTGAFFGLAVGLLWDALGGSVMGYYALLFMMIGLVVGVGGELFLQRSMFSSIIVSATAVLLQDLSTFAGFFMLRGNSQYLFALTHIIVPELLYSTILSIPLYFVIKYAIKGIQRAE